MLSFLHERVRAMDRLLVGSNAVLTKYNDADLDVDAALTGFLDETIAVYHTWNRVTAENRMLALKAECVTASQGTNPLTLERVTTNRRAMQRAVALRVLQASAEQLRTDVELDTKQLADVSSQLRPIVLMGIRKGLVNVSQSVPRSQLDMERLWRALVADEDIQLAARQVAMQVSIYDIQLLLDTLMDAAGA